MYEDDQTRQDRLDDEWLAYSLTCRLGWSQESFRQPPEEGLEKIYTTADGNVLVLWRCGWSPIRKGWREEVPSGVREEVTFYGYEWGWLTCEELFDARQRYPRTAP